MGTADVLVEIDADKLRKVIAPFLTVQNVFFEFREGSGFRVMLDNNMVYALLHVQEDAFNKIELSTALGEELFPVNIQSLNKNVLKNMKEKDNIVRIQFDRVLRQVSFRVGNLTSKQKFLFYNYERLNALRKLNWNEPNFDCEFEMLKSVLERGVRAVSGVGSLTEMTALSKGLILTSVSQTDEVNVEMSKEGKELECYEWTKDVQSIFNTSFLLDTLEMIDDKSQVRFGLSECKPLRMVWQPFDKSVMRLLLSNTER